MPHRTFILRRDTDVTGVSLTGDIAEGVQFSNGQVVLCWRTIPGPPEIKPSIAVWPDMESMIGVHGHDGATYPVWVDHTSNSGSGNYALTWKTETPPG